MIIFEEILYMDGLILLEFQVVFFSRFIVVKHHVQVRWEGAARRFLQREIRYIGKLHLDSMLPGMELEPVKNNQKYLDIWDYHQFADKHRIRNIPIRWYSYPYFSSTVPTFKYCTKCVA